MKKKHFLQRKAPLQVRAKLAAKKEQRLAELEEDNPEKAELLKEKKRWKDAETRLKGEKVRFTNRVLILNTTGFRFETMLNYWQNL